MKKSFTILTLFLITVQFSVSAEDFKFKYPEGDQYRIVSEVNETVLYNKQPIHNSKILNRIMIKIKKKTEKGGILDTKIEISELQEGSDTYRWGIEEAILFERTEKGTYNLPNPNAYLPSVRHVPSFPEKELKPGDTWTIKGEEVHDLLPFFMIDKKVKLSFNVFYKYTGTVNEGDHTYHSISINYNIYYEEKEDLLNLKKMIKVNSYPKKIVGTLKQELLWDNVSGRPYKVDETFEITYTMSNKDTYTFKGVSQGEAFYAKKMDKKQIKEDLKDLKDVEITETDEGLVLSFNKIQFIPDEANYYPEEEAKLKEIAELLKEYPDRDIKIVGHAAGVNRPQWERELSGMRAETIARYFINNKVREKTHIVTKGMGSSQPVASNATWEGQQKNRRVEIIILEN